MGRWNIDILGAHVQVSDDRRVGHNLFYVEMADSDHNVDELTDLLKRQDFVIEVRAEPRKRVYFESMFFPITSGGHYRVFALGGNEWAALVRSFVEKFGSAASSLLYQEGVSVGKSIAESVGLRFAEKPDGKTLVENFTALFRASGYGILRLSGDKEGFHVVIEEPVVSLSEEKVTDNFVVGIVAGALGKIYSRSYAVEDLSFEDSNIAFRLSHAEQLQK